jgi:hypothetical protein
MGTTGRASQAPQSASKHIPTNLELRSSSLVVIIVWWVWWVMTLVWWVRWVIKSAPEPLRGAIDGPCSKLARLYLFARWYLADVFSSVLSVSGDAVGEGGEGRGGSWGVDGDRQDVLGRTSPHHRLPALTHQLRPLHN